MPPKKAIKTEPVVTRGKSNLNCYWYNGKVYQILSDNKILLSAGGAEIEAETEVVRQFVIKNKLSYHKYIIESQIEYSEVLPSGKHKGLTVSELVDKDRQYAIWMRDKYNFGTQEKLKKEIIQCLIQ